MSVNIEIKSFQELSTFQLYSILKLRNEVFIVEQNCPYLDCDMKDISAFHILMCENVQIVSYARILPPGVSYNDYSSIGRVLTKSTHRRKKF
ncbi:MAG: putative acyltransferase [Bacteroidetes bacterium OLB11]|nr:MAG: putative acyltransferase [Bacteroidetes bacterium OLB11]